MITGNDSVSLSVYSRQIFHYRRYPVWSSPVAVKARNRYDRETKRYCRRTGPKGNCFDGSIFFCGIDLMSQLFICQLKNFTPTMSSPRRDSTTPVTRLRVFAGALFANRAATLAPRKVNRMQKNSAPRSGIEPSMKKWEAAPVNAVKAIINTLVPTAVFSS